MLNFLFVLRGSHFWGMESCFTQLFIPVLKTYLGAAILQCSYRALQRVATLQNQSLALQLCFGFKSLLPAPRGLLAAGFEGGLGRALGRCRCRGRCWCRAGRQQPRAAHSLPEAFWSPLFFPPLLFLGCCSMFFQHFLFQMKPKEYNPEQEVLLTRDPSPGLAAER